jgi:hypothetical protein
MSASKKTLLWFHRFVIIIGLIMLFFLIERLGPARIAAHIREFGVWGFLAILPISILDQILNAWAWRFTLAPQDAGRVPFISLAKGRLAGDGVNYLTPSATVAGEFVRPPFLGSELSVEVKNTSVFIGKLSQTLGQMAFILVGILFLILRKMDALGNGEIRWIVLGALFVAALIAFSLFILAYKNKQGKFFCDIGGPQISAIRENMRRYLTAHPIRMGLSVLFFTIGYASMMIEVAVICSFMNLPIDAFKALVIEALSNAFEAVFFMVPAKLGTQEAGKVLIFKAFGYTAGQGLSFAIIRHIREILWSSFGFLIYLTHRTGIKKYPGA